jgi:hypothetical protein
MLNVCTRSSNKLRGTDAVGGGGITSSVVLRQFVALLCVGRYITNAQPLSHSCIHPHGVGCARCVKTAYDDVVAQHRCLVLQAERFTDRSVGWHTVPCGQQAWQGVSLQGAVSCCMAQVPHKRHNTRLLRELPDLGSGHNSRAPTARRWLPTRCDGSQSAARPRLVAEVAHPWRVTSFLELHCFDAHRRARTPLGSLHNWVES